MLYLFRLLLFLINIDQETVLNLFGIENPLRQKIGNIQSLDISELSADVSLDTLRLILHGLWEKIQDGLTLTDIENVLFFILFIRFVILALRYNLKTSFYITCIGLVAGYLWYRHLIDLISLYRLVILKVPYLQKFGADALQLRTARRQIAETEIKLGENAHWYNPGQVLYYAVTKGMIELDPDTGLKSYIDPISMFVSNLEEPTKSQILPFYYKVYNDFIPKLFEICSKFWSQLSGIGAYAMITRVGKKYCPYLVRWHWTFLLVIGLVEQAYLYFMYRLYYFQTFIILPQTKSTLVDPNLFSQLNLLNGLIAFVALSHFGFVIFALFHAIWGQYFYIPFFVENTELHIGPRPKNSIYSGGNTAWQDSKEKNVNRPIPKLWYGWFGRGTQYDAPIIGPLVRFLRKILGLQNYY